MSDIPSFHIADGNRIIHIKKADCRPKISSAKKTPDYSGVSTKTGSKWQ
jgi:hypothetical protein